MARESERLADARGLRRLLAGRGPAHCAIIRSRRSGRFVPGCCGTPPHPPHRRQTLSQGIRHASVVVAGGGPVGLDRGGAALASRDRLPGRRSRCRLVRGQPRDLHLTPLAGSHGMARRGSSAARQGPAVGRRAQLSPEHRGTRVQHAERAHRALRADAEHPAVLRRAGGRGIAAGRDGERASLLSCLRRARCAGRRRGGHRHAAWHRDGAGWVAGGLRRRAKHGARASRPRARGHRVRGPLRHRGHRAINVAWVERLAWFDPPSNPGSTILMHRQPDGIWRIDYQLREEKTRTRPSRPKTCCPACRRTST